MKKSNSLHFLCIIILAVLLSSCWHSVNVTHKQQTIDIHSDGSLTQSERKAFEAGSGMMYFNIRSVYTPPTEPDSITLEDACDNCSILLRGKESLFIYAEFVGSGLPDEKMYIPIFIHSFEAKEGENCLVRTEEVPLILWNRFITGEYQSFSIKCVKISKRNVELGDVAKWADTIKTVLDAADWSVGGTASAALDILSGEALVKAQEAINTLIDNTNAEYQFTVNIAEPSSPKILFSRHILPLYYEKDNTKSSIGSVDIEVNTKISLLCDTPYDDNGCSDLQSASDIMDPSTPYSMISRDGSSTKLYDAIQNAEISARSVTSLSEADKLKTDLLYKLPFATRYDEAIALYMVSRNTNIKIKQRLLDGRWRILESLGFRIRDEIPHINTYSLKSALTRLFDSINNRNNLRVKRLVSSDFILNDPPVKQWDNETIHTDEEKIDALNTLKICRKGCYSFLDRTIGDSEITLREQLNMPYGDNFVSIVYIKNDNTPYLVHGKLEDEDYDGVSTFSKISFIPASNDDLSIMKYAKISDSCNDLMPLLNIPLEERPPIQCVSNCPE